MTHLETGYDYNQNNYIQIVCIVYNVQSLHGKVVFSQILPAIPICVNLTCVVRVLTESLESVY